MILLASLMQWAMLPSLTLAAPSYYDSSTDEAIVFALLVTMIFTLIIAVAVYVVVAFFMMKLFAKANVPAWKAWVPIVNSWKFLELGGYQGAFSLFVLGSFIPYVGWMLSIVATVFMCMAAYQIGLKNGKDGAWVVLYIFLGVVWLGIMGLGKSVWNDSLGKPALGTERPPSWPPYGTDGGYGGGQGTFQSPTYPSGGAGNMYQNGGPGGPYYGGGA